MPTNHTPDLQAHEASPPMPCPFCGVAPSVEHRHSGWRIACNNDNCPTRPDGFSYETRGEAVEVWNSTPFAAALTALKEWALASHAVEKADADVAAGGVEGYASLSQVARRAWESEQDKLTALRAAADALEDRG